MTVMADGHGHGSRFITSLTCNRCFADVDVDLDLDVDVDVNMNVDMDILR